MLLVYLTIAVTVVAVLVLAGYLIAVAWALMQARRNVSELADVLEAIASSTDELPHTVEEADRAVAAIAEVIPSAEPEAADIAIPVDRHVSASNI